jgi:DNA-nicking Smr family endonuclease
VKKRRPDPEDQVPAEEKNSELDEFARAMADVRPLPPDPRGVRVHARPPSLDSRVPAPAPAVPEPAAGDTTDDAWAADGVDRRELRKLKRGDYDPGDSLDVHGMTAAEALAAVRRFLDRSRARHRCVAIIHGRGLRSPGNVAVLKTRVRACLREHRLVLAFSDAPPDAGGPGAVYVLLRR